VSNFEDSFPPSKPEISLKMQIIFYLQRLFVTSFLCTTLPFPFPLQIQQTAHGKGEAESTRTLYRNSHQPVFLWALKLYVFRNKNIKKHGGEIYAGIS
jgi:hypothetical protein